MYFTPDVKNPHGLPCAALSGETARTARSEARTARVEFAANCHTDSRDVVAVPPQKVRQVEGKICFFAFADKNLMDEERYFIARSHVVTAAFYKAHNCVPSDHLRQLFDGICDFSDGNSDLDQCMISDAVENVVLDFPRARATSIYGLIRFHQKLILSKLYSLSISFGFAANSSFFEASEKPAFFYQRRSSTADKSGLPDSLISGA